MNLPHERLDAIEKELADMNENMALLTKTILTLQSAIIELLKADAKPSTGNVNP
jgi:prefoldin subunit 5